MKEPWRRRNWTPDLTDKKKVTKVPNLRVGWMMWWRAFLPLIILGGFLSILQVNVIVLMLFFLPVSLFLLDWAGKAVARKQYNVVATSIKTYTIPVPLTTAFVTLSNIGAGIWWRMIVFNILLFPLSFASSFLFSASPVAGIVSFLVFIFLQILIVGWVTNRVISRLFKLSFVATKVDDKGKRKRKES